MKIIGKLTFINDVDINDSLLPDNHPDMKIEVFDNSFSVIFTGDKIGTILSSVDDYLMNAKIASDIIKLRHKKNYESH